MHTMGDEAQALRPTHNAASGPSGLPHQRLCVVDHSYPEMARTRVILRVAAYWWVRTWTPGRSENAVASAVTTVRPDAFAVAAMRRS